MRKFASLFILLGCVMLGALGCPSKSSTPSSPAAPTNTPITPGTPTNTATNTATGTTTSTVTKTATSTLTGTPTSSATQTPTATVTNTATSSATATVTNTVTSTATSTATATPAYMTNYNFESGAEGWSASGVTGSTFGVETSVVHSGSQAVSVNIAGSGTETLSVSFSASDMTGKSLIFWAYIDSANITAIQPYVQSNDGGTYPFISDFINWPTSDIGHWVQFVFTPNFAPSGGAPSATTVYTFGVQFFSSSTGGNAYLDDVTVAPATTSWSFEDGQPDAFVYNTGSGIVTGGPMTVSAPGGTGDVSSFALTAPSVTFTAANQSCQLIYPFHSNPNNTGNWTTMGVSTLSADVMLDADISTGGSEGAQIFIQSGTGVYAFEASTYTNLTAGTWTHLTFTPTFGGGGDETNVYWMGVQFNTGGGTSPFGTANLKVDNLQLQ